MKILTIFLCMTFLSSCTSEPLSVRYYLLHTAENKVAKTNDKKEATIVLQLLNVAEYLRQPSLVMQVNQHELHYAQQDVWAEKLQTSFHAALLQDLNNIGKRNYVTSTSPEAINAGMAIIVMLEHFHATDESTVISSGHYWLSAQSLQKNRNENLSNSSHAFYFESELKQDGYAHAVKQLRTLVDNLANQIEKDIAALPNK